MNIQELKQLPKEELMAKLVQTRQALFHAREEVAAGKDANSAKLGQLRKDVARISTCISQLSHS